MANGLRGTIIVLFICLLGAEADSQEADFRAKPPQRESTDPRVLLELAADTVVYSRRSASAVDKTAVRHGIPLWVIVDGQTVEYAFERILQAGGEAVTWIGRNEAEERIFVTLSRGAAYVSLEVDGRLLDIASEQGTVRVIRGTAPRDLSDHEGYRAHRRALALEKLKPKSIREDAGTGRIRRIRAAGLGHVVGAEFVPSSDYRDALALGHDLDLRPMRGNSGEMTPTWAYKTYDQYLNGIRVESPVRIIYNRQTSEVTGVISPIYSAADAPEPAPDDVTAESAQAQALTELNNQFGSERGAIETAPQLVYGELDGQLKLLWTVRLRHRGAPFVAFVDVKTGTAVVRSTALPTHTCTANGSTATQCTDIQSTLVIGSNGQA